MTRLIIAILLSAVTIPVNYMDELVPVFTSFNWFGTQYTLIDGYNSADLLWGVGQKLQSVLMALAVFFAITGAVKYFRGSLPLKVRYALYATSCIVVVFNLYLIVNLVIDFVVGVDRNFMIWTLALIACGVSAVVFLALLYKKYNREAREREFQSRLETRMDRVISEFGNLSRDLEIFENVADAMQPQDNPMPWRLVLKAKARAMYESANNFLSELEESDYGGKQNKK